MDQQQIELEENTRNAEVIKEMIISTLFQNEKISEATVKEYMEDWQIVLIKSNWFKRWTTTFKKKKDSWYYKFVKFEN